MFFKLIMYVTYLKGLMVPYHSPRSLHSLDAGLLVVPRASKSGLGARAPVIKPLCCGNSFQSQLGGLSDTLCKRELTTFFP